jgi:diaminopimelate decarboxylase
LRVNTNIGAGHHVDVVTAGGGVKFGIDLAEVETARMVVEDSGRKVVGLHAHIGSGIDNIAPLIESARTLLDLSADFSNLRWINFGGGISVPYEPGAAEFPIDDYGTELTRIADRLLRARDLDAILEPGRYLVAESGTLISRVTSRRISGGQWWIGVDTGFNHLVRPSKYGAYHHIVNATNGSPASLRSTFDIQQMHEDVVVAGNLCESGDVFTRDESGHPITRRIDRTNVGDLLAFCDAGAYGFSMASLYNARLLPAEVLIDGDDGRLIRDRQTFDDLVRGMK